MLDPQGKYFIASVIILAEPQNLDLLSTLVLASSSAFIDSGAQAFPLVLSPQMWE